MRKSKYILIGMLTICMGLLSACNEQQDSQQTDASQQEEMEKTEYQVGGWKITYEGLVIESTLQNVTDVLGYSDVSAVETNKSASEGKQYCLMKLIFEKLDSSQEIAWENLKLKDESGNEYTRIDDSFLDDMSMKRLPGTNLNFGTNEGWIAYEINEDASNLSLTYNFEGEELNIEIN